MVPERVNEGWVDEVPDHQSLVAHLYCYFLSALVRFGLCLLEDRSVLSSVTSAAEADADVDVDNGSLRAGNSVDLGSGPVAEFGAASEPFVSPIG